LAYEVPGDLVEVGCYKGWSSVLISEVLRDYEASKRLHVYDSFEGLPSAGTDDGGSYTQGDLATTEQILLSNFADHGLRPPVIHKGWFADTLPDKLPAPISFAYLDGDFYDSILVSLEHVYPRLSPGAICLIDDYCDPGVNPEGWNYLPGVKKACDEFLADRPEQVCCLYSGVFSHAFFRKV
jgi:O-methyltransferase